MRGEDLSTKVRAVSLVTAKSRRSPLSVPPPAAATSRSAYFPLVMATPTPVDQIAIEERVAALAKRSIKTKAKVAGLKLAVSMMDLTTLEGWLITLVDWDVM